MLIECPLNAGGVSLGHEVSGLPNSTAVAHSPCSIIMSIVAAASAAAAAAEALPSPGVAAAVDAAAIAMPLLLLQHLVQDRRSIEKRGKQQDTTDAVDAAAVAVDAAVADAGM